MFCDQSPEPLTQISSEGPSWLKNENGWCRRIRPHLQFCQSQWKASHWQNVLTLVAWFYLGSSNLDWALQCVRSADKILFWFSEGICGTAAGSTDCQLRATVRGISVLHRITAWSAWTGKVWNTAWNKGPLWASAECFIIKATFCYCFIRKTNSLFMD